LLLLVLVFVAFQMASGLIFVAPNTLLVIKGYGRPRVHIGGAHVVPPLRMFGERAIMQLPLSIQSNNLTFHEVSIGADDTIHRITVRMHYRIDAERWWGPLNVPAWGRRHYALAERLGVSPGKAMTMPVFWEMLFEDVMRQEIERLLSVGLLQELNGVAMLRRNRSPGNPLVHTLRQLHHDLHAHLLPALHLRAGQWGLLIEEIQVTALELHDPSTLREMDDHDLRARVLAAALRVVRDAEIDTDMERLERSLTTVQRTVQPTDQLLAYLLSNAVRQSGSQSSVYMHYGEPYASGAARRTVRDTVRLSDNGPERQN
jgi:hypothetical protein